MYHIIKDGRIIGECKTIEDASRKLRVAKVGLINSMSSGTPYQGYELKSTAKGRFCVVPNCGTKVPYGDHYCTPCYAKELIGREVSTSDVIEPKINTDIIRPHRGY